MLNHKFIAHSLRKIAKELDASGDSSIFQKADSLISVNPAQFVKLFNSRICRIVGGFDGFDLQAVLPSRLNSDIIREIKDSKNLKDDLEDWLNDEESGIVIKCEVSHNPKIYLKAISHSLNALEYVGISSFMSYPFSENNLNGAKILNKETLLWEDFFGDYNPLLNEDKEIEKHLSSVL